MSQKNPLSAKKVNFLAKSYELTLTLKGHVTSPWLHCTTIATDRYHSYESMIIYMLPRLYTKCKYMMLLQQEFQAIVAI